MTRVQRRLTARRRAAVTALLFVLTAGAALAGPPYVTDDPEPVDLNHWEVYIASERLQDATGATGTLPHIELNNGPALNLQLHLILPLAFNQPAGSGLVMGLGDTELGLKYRFVQETKNRPMIGTFPLVEAPTGNAERGLGTVHPQIFLPVWLQKSRGAWTTYGGGGYWINPGAGNRDYWLLGWLLQKDLSHRWTLGNELYYLSPPAEGVSSQLNFNLGGQYSIDDGHHILFSAGRSIHGDIRLQSYLAFQWTFGPRQTPAEGKPADQSHG